MKKDKLIFDLIFSEKTDYEVEVTDYIKDIYYEDFIKEIKKILIKSKVFIINEKVEVNNNSNIIWKIKVQK